MVFNFNKCLTAVLLAVVLLSVAYTFETRKTNSYADTATYTGGDIVSYNMCLIGNTAETLTFPLITKDTVNSLKLKNLSGGAKSHITSSLSFDPSDYITYNEYNIYNFSITFRNKDAYNNGYSLTIPKMTLSINDEDHTYKTPNLSFCNDTYISNNYEYRVNSDDLVVVDTNTAYYTIPTSDNLASFTMLANKDVTIMDMKPLDYFTINDLAINGSPTEADSVYMKLRKENKFKATYSLSYNNYTYSNKILKSSIVIKYKVNDTYCLYISNAPLYVFPGYSKNYAMERYIDEL